MGMYKNSNHISFKGKIIDVTSIENEPWFPLQNICDILYMTNEPSHLARLLPPGSTQTAQVETQSGKKRKIVTNVNGLKFILSKFSDNPKVKGFKAFLIKKGFIAEEEDKAIVTTVAEARSQNPELILSICDKVINSLQDCISELNGIKESILS